LMYRLMRRLKRAADEGDDGGGVQRADGLVDDEGDAPARSLPSVHSATTQGHTTAIGTPSGLAIACELVLYKHDDERADTTFVPYLVHEGYPGRCCCACV